MRIVWATRAMARESSVTRRAALPLVNRRPRQKPFIASPAIKTNPVAKRAIKKVKETSLRVVARRDLMTYRKDLGFHLGVGYDSAREFSSSTPAWQVTFPC